MGIENFGNPVLPPEPEEEKKPEEQKIESAPQVSTGEIILIKEEIIARLDAEGFNEEIRQEIVKWREFRESLVQSTRDSIILNIDMFDMYVAAKMPEDAFDDASETYLQAMQEGEYDLVERILRIYPSLEGGLNII